MDIDMHRVKSFTVEAVKLTNAATGREFTTLEFKALDTAGNMLRGTFYLADGVVPTGLDVSGLAAPLSLVLDTPASIEAACERSVCGTARCLVRS